ncbi:uncharacterized protein PRCAT00005739001 [Priceomyces carsonii]|uniref:uncharacterized protein n=1 Tax=Priceomyces carsonii TaxID=28549 RepID=UPI002EDADBB5|nr:unnamed protein product [Priceomyces carsonii]
MYPHYQQNVYYGHPDPRYFLSHELTSQPLTPIDLAYSHSMLPSNLLMNSPYQRQYMPPQGSFFYPPNPTPNMASPSLSPYLTQLSSNSNLDQLNLSRTIILKNLSNDLTLNELLDEIDYGPIEYCKMFSKPAPSHMKDVDNLKCCYISFINSKVAVSFQLKYAKNLHNLTKLKEKLKNSKYLKISLNDPNANNSSSINKQDYIKLKTLNYIMELNATRCLVVKACLSSSSLFQQLDNDILEKCRNYGEVEDYRKYFNEEKLEVKVIVHFTSIDASIKTYEYFLKKIQSDKQDQIDQEGAEPHESIKFEHVSFHKDRCDRTIIDKIKPHSLLVQKNEQLNNLVARDQKLATIEKSDEDSLNRALENNESLRSTLVSNKIDDSEVTTSNDNIIPLDISCSSSTSPIVDSANVSFTSLKQNGHHSGNLTPSMTPHMRLHAHGGQLPPTAPSPSYQINPDPFNIGNRAIYLGNLHPNTTVEEIANNVRAGGLVESIKFHPDKRVCFITFIDPTVALKFYVNHQVLHQLIIHGYDITVGWAKNHSGPLSRDISLAVTAGASRNVYIGIKINKEVNPEEKLQLPSDQELRHDFSRFGEIEQINFYHNKDCGFLNFLNILDAIKLVELFETDSIATINRIVKDDGAFYNKYKNYKISFAKDRCGNPPKFSFRKRPANLGRKSSKDEEREQRTSSSKPSGPMSEEAAMVFGIISNGENNEELSEDAVSTAQTQLSLDKPSSAEASFKTEEVCFKDDDIRTSKEGLKKENISSIDRVNYLTKKKDVKKDKEGHHIEDQREGKCDKEGFSCDKEGFSDHEDTDTDKKDKNIDGSDLDGEEEEEEEEEDDDDDDDNISIIIESDGTTSTNTPNHFKRGTRKVYHNKFNSTESFGPIRNSSRASSSSSASNYMKHHHSQLNYGSPFSQQQQLYFNHRGGVRAHPQAAPMYANGYANNYYMQYPQVPPPPFPLNSMKNQYSSSGSQVMAQYLAKSQHDNLYYAASILSNDVEDEYDSDYIQRPRYSRSNSRR